jgi:hypothetical protein
MVGHTVDYSLIGWAAVNNPYIAVTSIAIPDKYYWAKVFSLKGDTSLFGVQYSTDGTMIIAHSRF